MSRGLTLLVVEDDTLMCDALCSHFGGRHQTVAASSCAEARRLVAELDVQVAILDLHLPDGDGLELVRLLRQRLDADVVVVTAYPKVETAVRALKLGALDYLNKPFDLSQLESIVERAVERRRLTDEVTRLRRERPRPTGTSALTGSSPVMQALREQILLVAASRDTTVLIRGESGSGKELCAAAIHHHSPRTDEPYVQINCSSIPASLFEAELFGHERGAFTDAKASRRGVVELADGGTLFLDEVGDLPVELQPKLLRLLEDRRFRRIGGAREIASDVRFVAATNRDLHSMVRAGRFREDLLYRLKVFELAMPPLREHLEDVPETASLLLAGVARRLSKPDLGLGEAAKAVLERHGWPGNVRELRNVVETAAIRCQGSQIEPEHLVLGPRIDLPAACDEACPLFPDALSSFPTLREIEDRYIQCVFRRTGQNKTRAAEILGVTRLTLRERLRGHGRED